MDFGRQLVLASIYCQGGELIALDVFFEVKTFVGLVRVGPT